MATRTQKVRLSIFLIVSSTLLLGFFLTLVGHRLLTQMDTYYIEYKDISVTGLEPGSAVKYHGVQVGRISDLAVKDVATIIVAIEVERGTPIKKDTEATMQLVGITGLKYIELIGGSLESEILSVGGTIVAGESVFETISGRAEIMIGKLEQVLNNLNLMLSPQTTESLQNALNSINDMTTQANLLLSENREHFSGAVTHLDTLIKKLSTTVDNVNDSVTSVNTIIKSEEITTAISNISSITARFRTQIDSLRLTETMSDFRTLVKNSNDMVVHTDLIVLRARDDILNSMGNLEQALENLRDATDVIRDNPSVLLRGRSTSADLVE
ncbi:MAG: MCE family protein [Candidatus Latescibacteria bacterium]|jgi:phospholipid/cholesterol/gamma-HCH transport system substrate-binding protein|nr:MCE family protein [Candidatus Latescibacterota bacterium]